MKKLNQIFFKGLIVVLPITLTFYLLYWASVNVESLFAPFLARLLGDWLYVPGLGILLSLGFIMLVGVLVSNYITARVFKLLTGLLEKVPLIKTVYLPLRDLMGLIPGKSTQGNLNRVVLVPLEPMGVKALGLVTRENLTELPGKNLVSVYIPLSYMLGGITVLIEPSKIEHVDIPVDVALKLSVTSWIKAKSDDESAR
jgi:uncharacterized membrane protein